MIVITSAKVQKFAFNQIIGRKTIKTSVVRLFVREIWQIQYWIARTFLIQQQEQNFHLKQNLAYFLCMPYKILRCILFIQTSSIFLQSFLTFSSVTRFSFINSCLLSSDESLQYLSSSTSEMSLSLSSSVLCLVELDFDGASLLSPSLPSSVLFLVELGLDGDSLLSSKKAKHS